jgi:hypothetical protein
MNPDAMFRNLTAIDESVTLLLLLLFSALLCENSDPAPLGLRLLGAPPRPLLGPVLDCPPAAAAAPMDPSPSPILAASELLV